MENEDWRYDKWPEFYLGKNVADFYDKDVEEKLNKLEEEEAHILEMEAEQEAAKDSSDEEDGIGMDDLEAAVKKVRGKISIIKQKHVLNSKRRARSKLRNVDDFVEGLKSKGINVNEEQLRSRSKSRVTIGDLEKRLDNKYKAEFGGSDDDSEELVEDKEEQKKRGRKRNRDDEEMTSKPKLGKRTKDADEDIDMDSESSEGEGKMSKHLRGSKSKSNMKMTPSQRKISM